MQSANTDRQQIVHLSSYALSGLVLLVAALLLGLLDGIPFPKIDPILNIRIPSDINLSLVAFVALPLTLAITVIIRAVSKTATDLVLALFTLPCLLAGTWALYEYFVAQPGVYWGGVVTIVAGTFLSFAVLVDAIIKHIVQR